MPKLSDFVSVPNLSVRPMAVADISSCVPLINEAFSYQETATGLARTSADKLRARMADSECYVLLSDSAIIGCVYVELLPNAIAKFGMLTIGKSYRRQGIGAQLIDAIERYTKARGATKLQLDYLSVAPQLQTYYEQLGFRETGERREWESILLIQMEKQLQ